MRFQISDRISEVDREHKFLYLAWRFSSIFDNLRARVGDSVIELLLSYLLFDYSDYVRKSSEHSESELRKEG